MSYSRILFSALLCFLAQYSFGQKLNNLDNIGKFKNKSTHPIIRISTGFNAQFFDNPFFKFQSKKYSDVTFATDYPISLGIDVIFPKPIFTKTHLIADIYYANADMGYSLASNNVALPGNVSAGLIGSFTMDGTLSSTGFGIGLYREISIHKRFFVGISSSLNLGTYFMDKYLTDTTSLNSEERTQPFFDSITIITLPPKITSFFNLRLKNEVIISYYISKSVAINLGFIYNIGLPNKAFERSFYLYNTNDMSKPISYNKAIFSNSSMEMFLGMNICL